MSKKLEVSIIGVTGYTGLELLRILHLHPEILIKYIYSSSQVGKRIIEIYPHLENVFEGNQLTLTTETIEKVGEDSDLIFFCLPNGQSQKWIKKVIGKTKIIDLSGDFRLASPLYAEYYKNKHQDEKSLSQFLYGLPEYNRDSIKKMANIANSGCFAANVQLALLPLKEKIAQADVFALTGSSGSGKNSQATTHHPLRNHNLKSYKILTHQHIPEILKTLALKKEQLNFVPGSMPVTRGIFLSAFITLKKEFTNMNERQARGTLSKLL